jgi:hypothetical protein
MARGGKAGKNLKSRSNAKKGKYTFVVFRQDRTVTYSDSRKVRYPTAKAARYQVRKSGDNGATISQPVKKAASSK